MQVSELDVRVKILQSGQLFGKFYLLNVVGQGATAKVYKALQQPINRLVALKIPQFSDSSSLLTPDDFLGEATVMARLEHDNIIRIYDFGLVENQPFICMEFVEDGMTLSELVEKSHPIPEPVCVSILLQIYHGLQYSHSKNVLHRDLSPKNILITQDGVIKITDFGLAAKRDLEESGQVMGTPSFLSPEHVCNLPFTKASDTFSFASLAYYLYTGAFLFDASEQPKGYEALFESIADGRSQLPEKKLSGLPKKMAELLRLAIQKPEDLDACIYGYWNSFNEKKQPEKLLGAYLKAGMAPDLERLRDTYVTLRSQGEHRRAMEVIEEALRKEPGNIEIQRLLSQPWQNTQASASQTVDVSSETMGSPLANRQTASPMATEIQNKNLLQESGFQKTDLDKPLSNPDQKSGPKKLLWLSSFLLIGTLAFLTALWYAKNNTQQKSQNEIPANSIPETQSKNTLTDQGSSNKVSPGPTTANTDTIGPKLSNDVTAGKQNSKQVQVTDVPIDTAKVVSKNTVTEPIKRPAPSIKETVIAEPIKKIKEEIKNVEDMKISSLVFEGPEGTIISVNDTLHFSSPSPSEGWKLPSGVLRFTLSVPGWSTPIRSSAYVNPGMQLRLKVDDAGGFQIEKHSL